MTLPEQKKKKTDTREVVVPIPQTRNQPEGSQCPQEPENAENAEDFGAARHGHHDVDERDKDQEAVQNVPAAPQVGRLAQVQAHGHHLRR